MKTVATIIFLFIGVSSNTNKVSGEVGDHCGKLSDCPARLDDQFCSGGKCCVQPQKLCPDEHCCFGKCISGVCTRCSFPEEKCDNSSPCCDGTKCPRSKTCPLTHKGKHCVSGRLFQCADRSKVFGHCPGNGICP